MEQEQINKFPSRPAISVHLLERNFNETGSVQAERHQQASFSFFSRWKPHLSYISLTSCLRRRLGFTNGKKAFLRQWFRFSTALNWHAEWPVKGWPRSVPRRNNVIRQEYHVIMFTDNIDGFLHITPICMWRIYPYSADRKWLLQHSDYSQLSSMYGVLF